MNHSMDPRLQLLEALQVPVWVFDTQSLKIIWGNSSTLQFWNSTSKEELYSRDMSDGISVSVKTHLTQTKNDCLISGHTISENWTLYPDGIPQTVEAVMSAIEFKDGSNALLVHVIYERKDETSDTLRSAKALVHTSAMISLYDEDFSLLYSNPAARAIAVGVEESLDQKIHHNHELQTVASKLEKVGSCETELEVNTANGLVWHSMNFQKSPDPVTGQSAILLSAIDITERRTAQQQAYKLAYTDSLTGLPNRIALLEHLNRICNPTPEKFGLFFLDLNRFKIINDSLGHQIGDNLLKEVGTRLSNLMKSRPGITSRLGGDEFVIVLENALDKTSLTSFAQNILSVLGEGFCIDGHNISILPSVGICTAPDDGDNVTTLMQHADVAMYAAKTSKAGFCFFEPTMNLHAEKRLEMENELLAAINENQFELYYQPKISTRDYSITGMEALIRWRNPTRGIISPVEFIPIAEETGLINQIGSWVITEAMTQQKIWQDMGHNIVVSINISPAQFTSSNLVNDIHTAAGETQCNPQFIEFEITESLLIGDTSIVSEMLTQLSNTGFRLALDDFGTGYSNLAYLGNYPLNCLKIDRQFIMDVKQTAILEMVIRMGKLLNLSVVAEGVETLDQIKLLKDNNCDELQGFYFSKPLPASNATDYIINYQLPTHTSDGYLDEQYKQAA